MNINSNHNFVALPSSQSFSSSHSSPSSPHSGSSSSSTTSASRAGSFSFSRLPLPCKIFIVSICVESLLLFIVAVVSVCYIFATHQQPQGSRDLNLSVIDTALVNITAIVGSLYFSIDSIRLQHRFQYMISIIAHSFTLVYVLIHWRSSDLGQVFASLSLSILILVSICEVLYLALSYSILNSFGRRMFSRLRNSKPEFINMYKTTAIFFSLLKLDVYLQLLLLMLAAFFLEWDHWFELFSNLIMLALTIGCFVIARKGIKTESTKLTNWFVLLSLFQPAYISWKLWTVWSEPQDYPQHTFEQFLFTGLLAILIRIGLIVFCRLCVHNFNRGLKERLYESDSTNAVSPSVASPLSSLESPRPQQQQVSLSVMKPKILRIVRSPSITNNGNEPSLLTQGQVEGEGEEWNDRENNHNGYHNSNVAASAIYLFQPSFNTPSQSRHSFADMDVTVDMLENGNSQLGDAAPSEREAQMKQNLLQD